MKRLVVPGLVLTLALYFSNGCGNVTFSGAIKTGSTIQGSVSQVQFGATGNIQVTFVTFLQNGTPFTMTFCGDQRAQFPLGDTVRVDFNPGQPCASVILVVIVV